MPEPILELNGLSLEILERLSYPSTLGISLKKTLRHIEKTALLHELEVLDDVLSGR